MGPRWEEPRSHQDRQSDRRRSRSRRREDSNNNNNSSNNDSSRRGSSRDRESRWGDRDGGRNRRHDSRREPPHMEPPRMEPPPAPVVEAPPETPMQRLTYTQARLSVAGEKVKEALSVTQIEAVKAALDAVLEAVQKASQVAEGEMEVFRKKELASERLRSVVQVPNVDVETLKEAIKEGETCGLPSSEMEIAHKVLESIEKKGALLQTIKEALQEPVGLDRLEPLQSLLQEAEQHGASGQEVEELRGVVHQVNQKVQSLQRLKTAVALAQQQQQQIITTGPGPASAEACRQLQQAFSEAEQGQVPEKELAPVRVLLEALLKQEELRQRAEQQKAASDQLKTAISMREPAMLQQAIQQAKQSGVSEYEISEAQALVTQLIEERERQAAEAAAAAAAATQVPAPPAPGQAPAGGPPMGTLIGGLVKRWDMVKGFGFITPDTGGPDAFAHMKDLDDGDHLIVGSRVMFEAVLDPTKGPGRYRAKVRQGAARREGYGGDAMDRLYILGLPVEIVEEQIAQIFGQYGTVTSVKKLPTVPGKSDAAAIVRFADPNQARWMVENVNNQIPLGLQSPIAVNYASDKNSRGQGGPQGADPYGGYGGGGAGAWGGSSTPSDRIYVMGLPLEIGEEQVQAVFSQYGGVLSAKKIPPVPGKTDSAAIVHMADIAMAKWLVENLNRNIPVGLSTPVNISFAQTPAASQQQQHFPQQGHAAAGGTDILIEGMPAGATQEHIYAVFGQYGSIAGVSLLGDYLGNGTCTFAVRMGDPNQAKWLVENLNRNIPVGMTSAVGIRYADATGGMAAQSPHAAAAAYMGTASPLAALQMGMGMPMGLSMNQLAAATASMSMGASLTSPGPSATTTASAAAAAPSEPSKQLFVEGLPIGLDESAVKNVFAQYGKVASISLVPPMAGETECTAFLKMEELTQAKWLVENLHRNIPVGLSTPVRLSYSPSAGGDEQPKPAESKQETPLALPAESAPQPATAGAPEASEQAGAAPETAAATPAEATPPSASSPEDAAAAAAAAVAAAANAVSDATGTPDAAAAAAAADAAAPAAAAPAAPEAAAAEAAAGPPLVA